MAVVWFLLNRRALAHLLRLDSIAENLERMLALKPERALSVGLSSVAVRHGPQARAVMRNCIVTLGTCWSHRGGDLEHASLYSVRERRWRTVLTLVLAAYGWQCLRAPGTYRWLDSLDLAIHEAGHLVFGFDGEVLTLLGGTLLQLLVPAAFVVALWRQGDRHGATVPLWWLGQNCWNISVYIRDAQAQELPLVGGGEHDWAVLLDQWGWLERDQTLGRAVFLIGVMLYGAALVTGWVLLYPRGRSASQEDQTRANSYDIRGT